MIEPEVTGLYVLERSAAHYKQASDIVEGLFVSKNVAVTGGIPFHEKGLGFFSSSQPNLFQ